MAVGTGDARQLTGASVLLATGPGTLAGWSFRETAAAVAAWRLRDGTTVSGEVLAVGSLPSAGSDTRQDVDVHFSTGLFFEVVSGTIEGAVWVA